MSHIEKLTRYVANFVDELAKSGLTHVVISPGSRSTPLAMAVCEHEALKEWIVVDERSAAYFALGMAKQTKESVALLCTSGSAAANYYPAIIEAHYNRVPLLVLTADRPHELRDVGAPQAIDQIKMYGDHVKWFQDMPLPEGSEEILAFSRTVASRAVQISLEGNAGPVHLNFPFREPLIPDFTINDLWGNVKTDAYQDMSTGVKVVHDQEIQKLLSLIVTHEKGLIVCGPQEDDRLAQAIAHLAQQWNIPLLADPLSQLRAGSHAKDHIIENYDAIFRNKQIRQQLKPDFIMRFGAMPVAKSYSFYTEEHKQTLHFIIEPEQGFRQPTKQSTKMIYADPVTLIDQLIQASSKQIGNDDWLKQWLDMNDIATRIIETEVSDQLTEGTAVKELLQVIPDQSILYVGNSMPVRDVDTFFMKTDREITLLANRGASGIEGLTSSALGVSATTKQHVTILLGDLSFYHDLNGLLLAKQYGLDLTVLLINNNGGGIFSFLPQADEENNFEKLFGTPLNIDFKQAVKMYQGTYAMVRTTSELQKKLTLSYQSDGLHVIEVQTNREENVKWHEQMWESIIRDLLENEH